MSNVMGKPRNLKGKKFLIVSFICVLFSIFVLGMNVFLILPTSKVVIIFLGFLLFLVFILYPGRKNSPGNDFTFFDLLLAFAGIIVSIYTMIRFDVFFQQGGFVPTNFDYIFTVLLILLVIEGSRRLYGLVIPGMLIFSFLYLKFGYCFPGIFAHKGFTLQRILIRMSMSDTGIFGLVLNIAVNFVFLFILFGSFLKATGATGLFSNLALALVGKRAGGPAEVSVVSSALMGTLSGSSIANVATTGSFTIPLMKKRGYDPAFAGGVEAAASTGGMITPPVMGAAALIMAAFLGIPYGKIMIAGIIPALLYYSSVFMVIEARAKKKNLKGLDLKDLPRLIDVLKDKGHLLLPIFILIYLLVRGNSPNFAATIGIVSTVLISAIRGNTRLSMKEVFEAMNTGARSAISVSVICAAIGIVVETISMTGIGAVLASGILSISKGIPIFAAFLVMLVSLVASIGLPATACYVIVASVAAPALAKFGIPALAIHFFVFWYGCISGMTPPVALASYTAAAVAGADPFKTAYEGLKISFAGFIIPFFIIFNPELLLFQISNVNNLLLIVTKTLLAVIAGVCIVEGYFFTKFRTYERLIMLVSVALLIQQGSFNFIGMSLVVIMLAINRFKYFHEKAKNMTDKY